MHEQRDAIRRADVRLALILSLGELQVNAGPDQRITAPAGVPGTSTALGSGQAP